MVTSYGESYLYAKKAQETRIEHIKKQLDSLKRRELTYPKIDLPEAKDSDISAEKQLTDQLAHPIVSKFFPENALPTEDGEREEALRNFVKAEVAKRNSALIQRNAFRTPFATPSQQKYGGSSLYPDDDLKNELKDKGKAEKLQQYYAQDQRNQADPQKKPDHYDKYAALVKKSNQQAHLSQSFDSEAEGAKAWLHKACDTMETIGCHSFAKDSAIAHNDSIDKLDQLAKKADLTKKDISDAETLLTTLNKYANTAQLKTDKAKIEAKRALLNNTPVPRLTLGGDESKTAGFNHFVDMVNTQRKLYQTTLDNLAKLPYDHSLQQEAEAQHQKLKQALSNLRQQLEQVDETYLKAANITGANYQDIFAATTTLRQTFSAQDPVSKFQTWRLGAKASGTSHFTNSYDHNRPSAIKVWKQTSTGDWVQQTHMSRDKNGAMVETKLSFNVVIRTLQALKADPEFMANHPFTLNIKHDSQGNPTKYHVNFKNGKDDLEYALTNKLIPAQQRADKKVAMEAESAAPQKIAAATLEEKEKEEKEEKGNGPGPSL